MTEKETVLEILAMEAEDGLNEKRYEYPTEAADLYDALMKVMREHGKTKLLLNDAETRAAKYARTLDSFRAVAVEIAASLAFAGSSDHRTKNEALLTAIARLLALTTNHSKPRDMDDIPF